MSADAPTTSVVISTYDEKRWADLAACVESLSTQTLPAKEVIVVVDHNQTLLERAERELAGVRVIPNRRSQGLAGARNSGAAAATAEILVFIDDDARADSDWLRLLVGCFDEDGVAGAGGGLIPSWQGKEAGWMPPAFYWVIGCSYTGLPEERAPVRNPIGANMSVRADLLARVGGFREGGEKGGEAPRELRARGVVRAGGNVPDDTDFAIRVAQRMPDAVWLYEPKAIVHHSVTPERATLGYFIRRCFEEGIGKASLARLVGSEMSLSSERRQVLLVLPRSVLAGFRQALRGQPSALLQVAATVLGLATTAAGFAIESVKLKMKPAEAV